MNSKIVRDLEIVLDHLNEVGAWSHADVVSRLEGAIKACAVATPACECDELDCENHWGIDAEPLGDAEAQFSDEHAGKTSWLVKDADPEDHVDSIHCGCKGCAS